MAVEGKMPSGKEKNASLGKGTFKKFSKSNKKSSDSETLKKLKGAGGKGKSAQKNEKGAETSNAKKLKHATRKVNATKFRGKQQTGKKRKQFAGNKEGTTAKKPKWDDYKNQKKELKQNRQQDKKTNYDLIFRSKHIWETVRRNTTCVIGTGTDNKLQNVLQLIRDVLDPETSK
ncbi:pumilio homolog 3-like, partial [Rhincodon typus]|uniref:pumilio homolog 3-like n=1 Tax=Rhincodon typus TaxID=259920 RepID=UPI00202FA708